MTPSSPGAVVLVRFPFTHLRGAKKRPAVVISPAPYALRYEDVVALALTSQPQPDPFLSLQHWRTAGLLGPSWIKPAVFTLGASVIDRQVGFLDPEDAFRIPQALALLLDGRFLP
jgi:mRNA-degrading endonuclease toxin of MazEF toxin-antitoxin module